MQVDIAEHASPRGVHLVDIVVLRVFVAELIIQHLLKAMQISLKSTSRPDVCRPERVSMSGQGRAYVRPQDRYRN